MSFGLKLTDLNDFIQPSQECIKPVKIDKTQGQTSKIIIREDGEYTGITERGEEYFLEKVNITLNDCLACSGCITSAESILIEQQSVDKLLSYVKLNDEKADSEKSLVVVSMSPQSRASIASRFELSIESVARRLTTFFKDLGADFVIDTSFARELSQMEMAREFLGKVSLSSDVKNMPLLASSCPGWICYAEKTHGSWILPFISRVRSSQQILGKLVKHHLPSLLQLPNKNVYHVSIAPCFDKKLEASRDEFNGDVDLVIATNELEQLLLNSNINLNSVAETSLDTVYPMINSNGSLYNTDESGADGYLSFLLAYSRKTLFAGMDTEVVMKECRNRDMQEVLLIKQSTGEELLRFAYAYGFRNIQTVVQQMKRRQRQRHYHFVEIMACPSGCLNGGGQIRVPGVDGKETLTHVREKYFSIPTMYPVDNEEVMKLIASLDESGTKETYLYTNYMEVKKVDIITKLATNW